jgi:site-specific DNA-methyltransferase (adenine-specific)
METKIFFHNQFLRISRGWVIVFSPPKNQWILPADQYLFWEKPISTKNTSKHYSNFIEMIFVYGYGTWNADRHWSQYTNVFKDLVDEKNLHAHRKPPSLIERLIRNHTNEGDIILDPFCGSGVVGEVAECLNRNCISVDQIEMRQEAA